MTTVYSFKAGYTRNGIAGAPSGTPTISIVDSANNIYLSTGTPTIPLTNLPGAYVYLYSGTDGLDLLALFHTSDATMDAQDLFGIPTINLPLSLWAFTGTRSLNGIQNWNLIGNISGTLSTVINLVSGTTGGGGLTATQVWSFAPRTLTNQIFNLPPVQQGNNLTVVRGDTLSWSPTNLGSLINHSKILFTVKRLYTDKDSEALVQISDTGGLLVINGLNASSPLNGSIVINDVNLGNLTVTLAAVETAKLDTLQNIYYDIQLIRNDGTVTTLVYGLFTILGDSSRATS